MARRKRVEAWAVFDTGEDNPWLDTFADAKSATEMAVQWSEDGHGPQSVVRLVECGPGEVPMPREAAAVVRAAVRWERDIATRNLHDNAPLRFAVMRMQKGRK